MEEKKKDREYYTTIDKYMTEQKMENLCKSFKDMNAALKRLNKQRMELLTRKRQIGGQLYSYMNSRELKSVDGIKIAEVRPPKPASEIKDSKEKKKERIISYLENKGEMDTRGLIERALELSRKRNLEKLSSSEEEN